MPTMFWIEILKLGAQFAGALVVARLAVSWALRRYKSEKVWERRLRAYAEASAALGEMRLVVGRWHDELIMARKIPEDESAAQRDRYQAARRRLEEGVATAALLLPSPSAALLTGLDRELERSRRGQDQIEDLDAQYAVLDRTIKELTAQGRQELGTEFGKPWPRADRGLQRDRLLNATTASLFDGTAGLIRARWVSQNGRP